MTTYHIPASPRDASPDWAALAARAREMDLAQLCGACRDAHEAAVAADALELAGACKGKTGGYYRDEISVYFAEIRRRGLFTGMGDLSESVIHSIEVDQSKPHYCHNCGDGCSDEFTSVEEEYLCEDCGLAAQRTYARENG